MLKFTVPIRVIPAKNKLKGKRYYLNLNVYRGAHRMVLAAMKREFHAMIEDMVTEKMAALSLLTDRPMTIIYVVYPFQKVDQANVACIIDKFFCDVLQSVGAIPNDDAEHIPEVRYLYGEVDRNNPRCEIFITNHYRGLDKNRFPVL